MGSALDLTAASPLCASPQLGQPTKNWEGCREGGGGASSPWSHHNAQLGLAARCWCHAQKFHRAAWGSGDGLASDNQISACNVYRCGAYGSDSVLLGSRIEVVVHAVVLLTA